MLDHYIEKMADFYSSEFVKLNMPWILNITFYEFLQREYIKKYNKIFPL